MNRTFVTSMIALLLAMLGLGIFYYKTGVLSYPVKPSKTVDSWYVEFSVNIDQPKKRASASAVDLTLLKPKDNARYVVTNLQLIAPDFGVENDEEAKQFILTKRKLKKRETILLRYNIYAIDNPEASKKPNIKKYASYQNANRIYNPDDKTRVLYEEIDAVIDGAKSRSADPISFAKQVVKTLNEKREMTRFFIKEMDVSSKESAIVQILGAAKVDARVARGFELKNHDNRSSVVNWLEVYDYKREKWIRIATDYLNGGNIKKFFLWSVGDENILEAANKVKYSYNLSSKANTDGSLTREIWLEQNRNPFLSFFSLQTLPLEQQFVVQILLLIPLGALIVSFFRQVIGFQTIGTFMPVLIALAFRETGLIFGIVFFFCIILVGLLARAMINKLHLLMVPRLSIVLSIIVLFIVFLMLATKNQNLSLGISVALFPVVIITMFIERISTILDEKGPMDAFYGFLGSMLIATVIYLGVLNNFVMHVIFVFPELLFIVIGLSLLLGRYNGYKLMEFWRFRQMQKTSVNIK